MAKLLLLVATVAIMLQASSAAPIYSGDWLAQELDMETPKKAQEAINKTAANTTPVRATATGRSTMTPEEVARAEQRRQPYQTLMASGRWEEALKLIDNLISQDEESTMQTAYLRYDRVSVLKSMNRYIEALVEMQRLRQLLTQIGEPTSQLGELVWRMEQELENMGDYQKLQLAPGASKSDIRKSYKNLMIMLHPDKISARIDLDDKSKTYIAGLYDNVRAAYDTLVAS